jgi:aryl-alcohol dehydrogenase-like predicted oxidoreductase
MEYTRLGTTGLKVSRICLGTMTYGTSKWREWVLNEEESRPFYKRAIEAGINFFDTADMYSNGVSEEVTGRALKDFGTARSEVVIATKLFNAMGDAPNRSGLSRKHIHHAVDESLRRLGTDYIDLYQIHRYDPGTPIEETLDALNDLVHAGKVLYLGASSMFAWQFARMLGASDKNGWARFVTMQNHYNLLYREEEREMNPLCAAEGVGIIPWSPLARGVLAGNRKSGTVRAKTDAYSQSLYGKDVSDSDQKVVDHVHVLAEKRGIPAAQVALAWLLHKPEVTAPIVGASKPHHLEDAIASLSVKLSAEDIAFLEAPYIPHPVAGH